MASDSSDAALHGKVRLLCPDGWSADPAELPFVLPPGEHLETDVVLTMPAGAAPGLYPVRAELAVTGSDAASMPPVLAPGGRGRVRGVGRCSLQATTCCG